MSLDKKGFAELIESAINEFKNISEYNKNNLSNVHLIDESDISCKYNRCMKELALSKMKRLYSILSVPAYSRIMTMEQREIEDYRKYKISEITSSINRLMLAMEVSKKDEDNSDIKKKVDSLIDEQNLLKEMSCEVLKKYVLECLNIEFNNNNNDSFDGKAETETLQNIIKDIDTLSKFLNLINDYRKLEREIKSIRSEQIIIYNDLINDSIKNDISLEEVFNEETLKNLQTTIAEKIKVISDFEINIKKDFSSKIKKMYYNVKSDEYKTINVLPYEKGVLEAFEEIIPSRTIELAKLQNEEWLRLNKKVFKTSEVNNTIGILCMEIDDTKKIIESFIRDWYKNAYYYNPLFNPVSSRASGKFEYSLGAKNCLDNFINFGVWPEEKDVDSLKLCLKLNRIEAEKSVIYAEQIKERLSRLFNVTLDTKKKELQDLDERITSKFGNWKNEVILSIINEIK